jgi:thioredoxin-dependent peroxiredoxin
MSQITLKGNACQTCGELPAIGTITPEFKLTKSDLQDVSLKNYQGKKIILNIFPSVDTPVCATSVRTFTKEANSLNNVVVLHISADLPFAQKRFCGAEGIENAETLSCFRSSFAEEYGVEIIDGPLRGLCARAIVVVDESHKVLYTELVPEIAQEANYEAALNSVK